MPPFRVRRKEVYDVGMALEAGEIQTRRATPVPAQHQPSIAESVVEEQLDDIQVALLGGGVEDGRSVLGLGVHQMARQPLVVQQKLDDSGVPGLTGRKQAGGGVDVERLSEKLGTVLDDEGSRLRS